MKYFTSKTNISSLKELLSEPVYFVSGIDTDAGKTVATGYLSKTLLEEGVQCLTQKFIQTGVEGVSEDILVHRSIEQRPLLPEDKDGSTCPLLYTYPCSPHMAAAIDQKPIALEKVEQATAKLQAAGAETILLEGAGGLMVPLSEDLLTIDYLIRHQLPCILVCTAKLGSINHTLLSLEALKSRNIRIPLIVYNRHVATDKKISEESARWLQQYLDRHYPQCTWIELESRQW